MGRRFALILALTLAACSRLVDLDGISGGKPAPVPEKDGGVPDASSGPDGSPIFDADTPDARPSEPDAQADGTMPEVDAGNGCPTGFTRMLRVVAGAERYCVDEHEVTREQYRDFVESEPDLSTLYKSEACKSVTDIKPNNYPPLPQDLQLPVSEISFCGAEAYCKYAGKTLCGSVKGGPVKHEFANSPTYGALARACAGAANRKFAYGEAYEATACNGAQNAVGAPLPVATKDTCVTADTGIFDLSGNVWEWIDACDSDVSTADSCYAQGGAYNSPDTELSCDAPVHYAQRITRDPTVGFRCCAR